MDKYTQFSTYDLNSRYSLKSNHSNSRIIQNCLSNFKWFLTKWCPNFKWLSFWISDSIPNLDHLQIDLFAIIGNPDMSRFQIPTALSNVFSASKYRIQKNQFRTHKNPLFGCLLSQILPGIYFLPSLFISICVIWLSWQLYVDSRAPVWTLNILMSPPYVPQRINWKLVNKNMLKSACYDQPVLPDIWIPDK